MKTILILLVVVSVACALDERQQETIHQNFPAAKLLDIGNVNGYIHVTGYNGNEIQMTAEKTIEARSRDRMEAAKRDVKLEITQSAEKVSLQVQYPSRQRHWHNYDFDYNVTYDFEIKVPVSTSLRLGTVNQTIDVSNVTGDFDVRNVNGRIELTDISGSGDAHTVNGRIVATFAKNPERSCSFRTVNGGIEASFRPNLAADVRVKTLHGGAFTDFEATGLPVSMISERRNGKLIYRSDRTHAFRIGNGGPELKFDTLNGSIRILKRGQ